MITRIILDNMYDKKGGKMEYDISSKIMTNQNSTYDEWFEFNKKVEVIKKVKELFQYDMTVIPDFEYNQSKESVLEIQTKMDEKIYTYSIVFYNSELVMESLLEDQNWIFSRLKDNPGFALNNSYLNERGKECYEKYKDIFPATSLLFCFKPGEEILKDLRNIMIVDDWMSFDHYTFVNKFNSTFSDLSYNTIVNEMIQKFGFSEDYERLDEDNKHLIFSKDPMVKIRLELAGSGFRQLSRLYPLMVASKKRGFKMIATIPYDYCLHPIVGNALMKWFLEDNPNPPIGKLSNIVL